MDIIVKEPTRMELEVWFDRAAIGETCEVLDPHGIPYVSLSKTGGTSVRWHTLARAARPGMPSSMKLKFSEVLGMLGY